ncbi:hypothetical protein DENIT_10273 [Pseudomonas veronii]|nr:hypothetical protein DENIT_10273 [Pseudomonas veronii]
MGMIGRPLFPARWWGGKDGECLANVQPNSVNPELTPLTRRVTLPGISLTVIRPWTVTPTLTPRHCLASSRRAVPRMSRRCPPRWLSGPCSTVDMRAHQIPLSYVDLPDG